MKQFFKVLESIAILLIIATITSCNSADENKEESKLGTEEDIVVSEEQSNTQNTVEPSTTEEKTISGVCGDNLTWNIDEYGVLTIDGIGEMYDFGLEFDIETMRNIPTSPWKYNHDIKSIILNDGVTSIGKMAFSSCDECTSITIPNSVKSIGNSALSAGTNLVDIYYSGSEEEWKKITPDLYFGKTDLADTTIHCDDADICYDYYNPYNNYTFDSVQGGVNIISYIGSNTDVIIPEKITGEDVISISDEAFKGSKIHSVVIPDTVITIGDRAFEDCSLLSSVTIGNGVTTLGDSLFESCHLLSDISIGNSVTKLSKKMFYDCKALAEIELPDNIVSIDDQAFDSCSSISTFNIPDSIENIGKSAFGGCSSLSNISIGKNVNLIDDNAFQGCSALSAIVLPDRLTVLGKEAFRSCPALSSVTIPAGLIKIGADAFNGTPWLTIEQSKNPLVIVNNILIDSENFYSDNENFVIPSGVTAIADNIFFSDYFGDYGFAKITIPDSVISIGDNFCLSCFSLKEVSMGNNVKIIGDSAFKECVNLKSITIPDSVTEIGNNACCSCYSLAEVKMGNGVISIGDSAFSDSAISSISIPDSVNTIGDEAFYYCGNLSDISFGNNISHIGYRAFFYTSWYYKKIEENTLVIIGDILIDGSASTGNITIPDGIREITPHSFENCETLLNVTIPESVTEIGDSAFKDCKVLSNVDLPNSITSIGSQAFENCMLLKVTIPESVTEIGDSAFRDCHALSSIDLPNSITSIGENCFKGCQALVNITYNGEIYSDGIDELCEEINDN